MHCWKKKKEKEGAAGHQGPWPENGDGKKEKRDQHERKNSR